MIGMKLDIALILAAICLYLLFSLCVEFATSTIKDRNKKLFARWSYRLVAFSVLFCVIGSVHIQNELELGVLKTDASYDVLDNGPGIYFVGYGTDVNVYPDSNLYYGGSWTSFITANSEGHKVVLNVTFINRLSSECVTEVDKRFVNYHTFSNVSLIDATQKALDDIVGSMNARAVATESLTIESQLGELITEKLGLPCVDIDDVTVSNITQPRWVEDAIIESMTIE